MQAKIFGELQLRVDGGRQVLPTASKPRTVFALLLTRLHSPVRVDELLDEVWGPEPPTTATTALQCYVSQLRKSIAGALPGSGADCVHDVLITKNSSYELVLDPDDVDLYRQRALHRRGLDALAEGDNEGASACFTEGLRLRGGCPFADVRCGTSLEIESRAIDEQGANLEELNAETQLRLGRHESVLDGLVRLTAHNPLREGLQALYMVALSRAGRRAEALEVYREVHSNLVAETGVEPSERFRDLHRRVLNQDSALVDPCRHQEPVWTHAPLVPRAPVRHPPRGN